MLLHNKRGDGEEMLLIFVIGLFMGAFCGAIPLVVGLLRGNKSMAWIGFGVSILVGIAYWYVALLPAIAFTIIAAVTEPIEKGRKRKGQSPRRRRRDRA